MESMDQNKELVQAVMRQFEERQAKCMAVNEELARAIQERAEKAYAAITKIYVEASLYPERLDVEDIPDLIAGVHTALREIIELTETLVSRNMSQDRVSTI